MHQKEECIVQFVLEVIAAAAVVAAAGVLTVVPTLFFCTFDGYFCILYV